MTFFATSKRLREVSRRKYHELSDPTQEWPRQGGLVARWVQQLLKARADHVLQLCVAKAKATNPKQAISSLEGSST